MRRFLVRHRCLILAGLSVAGVLAGVPAASVDQRPVGFGFDPGIERPLVFAAEAGAAGTEALAESGSETAFTAKADGLAGEGAGADDRCVGVAGPREAPHGIERAVSCIEAETALEGQSEPTVASTGDVAFVAWTDFAQGQQIAGVRLANDGTVLSPGVLRLSALGRIPAVAAARSRFLVVWYEYGVGIRGVLVSASDGSIGETIRISPDSSVYRPAVASDGDGFLVVWEGNGPKAARVSGGGVVDAVPLTAGKGEYPDVAWNGDAYQVAWVAPAGEQDDVVVQRIARNGSPAGVPTPIGSAGRGDVRTVEAGRLGDGTLVTWWDFSGIWARRVGGDGVPSGERIAISERGRVPDVTSNGGTALLAWVDSDGSGGVEFAPDGRQGDRFAFKHPTGGGSTAAPAGSRWLFVWVDGRNARRGSEEGDADIFGAFVDPDADGVPSDFPVSISAGPQQTPALAWNGEAWLCVWRRGIQLFASRVSATGEILDGAGLRLMTWTSSSADGPPSVTWNGKEFLAIWTETDEDRPGGVYGARITADGRLLDPKGFAISTGGYRFGVDVAGGDGESLVTWSQGTRSGVAVFAARVRDAHVFAPVRVSPAPVDQRWSAVAWNGHRWLVAWETEESHIRAARVSASGALEDPSPQTVSAGGSRADVGASGDTFLVAWESAGIRAARLDDDGRMIDAGPIVVAAEPDARGPHIGRAGAGFLVAWGRGGHVGAARVTGAGVAEGIGRIDPGSGPSGWADAAGGPGGKAAVVYQRYAPESPYFTTRVFLQAL